MITNKFDVNLSIPSEARMNSTPKESVTGSPYLTYNLAYFDHFLND